MTSHAASFPRDHVNHEIWRILVVRAGYHFTNFFPHGSISCYMSIHSRQLSKLTSKETQSYILSQFSATWNLLECKCSSRKLKVEILSESWKLHRIKKKGRYAVFNSSVCDNLTFCLIFEGLFVIRRTVGHALHEGLMSKLSFITSKSRSNNSKDFFETSKAIWWKVLSIIGDSKT